MPTAKLVRQTRRHHLGDRKPRGLYLELETYWAFEAGVTGASFAEIFASTIERIATQLETGVVINDPALAREYDPAPDSADLDHAATTFRDLATKAGLALAADRCEAGRLWREILGKNERNWVFPIPAGCDEYGKKAATLIADDRVSVIGTDGVLLRELVLDAGRDYQPRLHSSSIT